MKKLLLFILLLSFTGIAQAAPRHFVFFETLSAANNFTFEKTVAFLSPLESIGNTYISVDVLNATELVASDPIFINGYLDTNLTGTFPQGQGMDEILTNWLLSGTPGAYEVFEYLGSSNFLTNRIVFLFQIAEAGISAQVINVVVNVFVESVQRRPMLMSNTVGHSVLKSLPTGLGKQYLGQSLAVTFQH